MTKNPDNELVTRGAVKEVLRELHEVVPEFDLDNIIADIDNLPAVKIKSRDPDYRAMWEGIKKFINKKEDLPSMGRWFWKDMMAELSKIQAKHTPQTGVKKEET